MIRSQPFPYLFVTVDRVDVEENRAYVTDAYGKNHDIPMSVRPGALYPREGEGWFVDTTYGTWTFDRLVQSNPPVITGEDAGNAVARSIAGVLETLGLVINDTTEGGGAPPYREVGEIIMFGASTPPTGWLACDGAAVSRTDYSDLFAVIATTYGVGDGSTTFNLPDMGARFPVGVGTGHALASTGGSASTTLSVGQLPSHTHTTPNHSHTIAHTHTITHTHALGGSTGNQSANHTHSGSTLTLASQSTASTNHVHGGGAGSAAQSINAAGSTAAGAIGGSTGNQSANHTHTLPANTGASNTASTGASSAGNSGTAAPTTDATGSGDSIENRPPYLTVNFIIYAGA